MEMYRASNRPACTKSRRRDIGDERTRNEDRNIDRRRGLPRAESDDTRICIEGPGLRLRDIWSAAGLAWTRAGHRRREADGRGARRRAYLPGWHDASLLAHQSVP